jgi:hypothetical protein
MAFRRLSCRAALAEVKGRPLALGSEPPGNKPDEFTVFLCDDQAKWAKPMAAPGIEPE